jgi:MFS superfamily sulfate permease-like transporter
MQRWIERPEARWAFWAGAAGALAAAAVSTVKILASGPGAAFSFVLVPLIAVAAAVPCGVWGTALGHVVLHLRGRAQEPKVLFWVALIATVGPPSAYFFSYIRS